MTSDDNRVYILSGPLIIDTGRRVSPVPTREDLTGLRTVTGFGVVERGVKSLSPTKDVYLGSSVLVRPGSKDRVPNEES